MGVLYLVIVLLFITLCPSSFAIMREREMVAFLCQSVFSVALPRGAVDYSAVCDCGAF